jgi:hypothetical protein
MPALRKLKQEDHEIGPASLYGDIASQKTNEQNINLITNPHKNIPIVKSLK